MSKSQLEMVKEFHVATGSPVLDKPGIPPHDRVRLRCKLIMEEALEAVGAMIGFHDEDVKRLALRVGYLIDQIDPQAQLPEVAKELNDLLYVTHGALLEFGIPEKMFDAVHENNMTKISGPVREDGKRLKPPGYVKFDAVKWLAENGLGNGAC